MSTASTHGSVTDLVLEGGGVRGIGLVGAVQRLAESGYAFGRVGGSSAGALVGALVAALVHSGEPISRLADLAATLDYRRFRDRGTVGRALGPLGFLADAVSLLMHDGAYRGDYLHDWLAGVLRDLGVVTFGDLRMEDPGSDGEPHHRWRLVVTASDLSRHRLVYLPWDYADYGLDPDEQRVADAVRASASLPFFFEPVTLTGSRGATTLVDGGLVSNYPISMFDRADGKPSRWPTIGVRIDGAGNPDPAVDAPAPVRTPGDLGVALVLTAIEGCQAEHVQQPCNLRRSILVDPGGIGATDFGLTRRQQDRLLVAGRHAARAFLTDWSFERWRAECR